MHRCGPLVSPSRITYRIFPGSRTEKPRALPRLNEFLVHSGK